MKNLFDLTHEYKYEYQSGLLDYFICLEVTPQGVDQGCTELRVKKSITCVDTQKSYNVVHVHKHLRVLSLGNARKMAANFINECIEQKIIK